MMYTAEELRINNAKSWLDDIAPHIGVCIHCAQEDGNTHTEIHFGIEGNTILVERHLRTLGYKVDYRVTTGMLYIDW